MEADKYVQLTPRMIWMAVRGLFKKEITDDMSLIDLVPVSNHDGRPPEYLVRMKKSYRFEPPKPPEVALICMSNEEAGVLRDAASAYIKLLQDVGGSTEKIDSLKTTIQRIDDIFVKE